MSKEKSKKKKSKKVVDPRGGKSRSKEIGKKAKVKKEIKKGSVQDIANKAILAGKDTDGVIEAVKEKHPDSKISASSVGWYRGELKKAGHKLKEQPRGPKKGSVKSPGSNSKAKKETKADEGEGGF